MKIKLFLTSLLFVSVSKSAFPQSVGIGTTSPDPSAQLDISSTTKGFLVPRMSKANRFAIATPATGLLVYQNGPDSAGFYHFDGSKWNLAFSYANADSMVWLTRGNAGTNPTIHYFGTKDNQPLSFRQNNKWLGRWNSGNRNYSIGDSAGANNTNGITNIAIGSQALKSNTVGSANVAIGDSAMANGTGFRNVVVGSKALKSITGSPSGNVAIGSSALSRNLSISNLTAIGDSALANLDIITSYPSLAIGSKALKSASGSTTGNLAVGNNALTKTNQGNSNVAVGIYAMEENTNGDDNIAIGFLALQKSVAGFRNVAIGARSMSAATVSIFDNTAIGFQSLVNNSGNYNTAVGSNSLANNTAGNNNIAMGYYALASNNTGDNNIAIGNNSQLLDTSGNNNISIGNSSLSANRHRSANVAIGSSALSNTGTGVAPSETLLGNFNTAIGNNTLFSNTSGFSNSAVGAFTMQNLQNGFENSAFGAEALYFNKTGTRNVAVGYASLRSDTSGFNNTALGSSALSFNIGGTANTAVGFGALYSNLAGNNNTAIGSGADVSTGGLSNATAIGYNAIVSASNSVVLGNFANVGIGISAPTQKLHVVAEPSLLNAGYFVSSSAIGANGNAAPVYAQNNYAGSSDVSAVSGIAISTTPGYGYGGYFRSRFIGVSGETQNLGGTSNFSTYGVRGSASQPTVVGQSNFGVYGSASNGGTNYGVYCNGNGGYTGTWTLVSDVMFKQDVNAVSSVLPLVKQLNPVNYQLKREEYPNMNFPLGIQFGFVAQELEKLFPTLVENGTHPGETKEAGDMHFKAVNYIGLIPVLTKAIQEQQQTIEALKELVNQQQGQINTLLNVVKNK